MWLTPPAMVQRQNIIEQINTNITQAERDLDGIIISTNELVTNVTTPGNHWISVERGYLTLLGDGAVKRDQMGREFSWEELITQYGGILKPSETKVILRSTLSEDTSSDIVGTIQPTDDPNILYWQPDASTLPRSTVPSIDAIIDPLYSSPGDDNLPAATTGQRYLLTGDLAGPSQAWGSISARGGSIIQYNGTSWFVSFDASNEHGSEYVINRMTGRQLKWDTESRSWVMAIDGIYSVGFWRLGIV